MQPGYDGLPDATAGPAAGSGPRFLPQFPEVPFDRLPAWFYYFFEFESFHSMLIHAIFWTWAVVVLLLCAPAPCAASDGTASGETFVVTLDDDRLADTSSHLVTTNHVTFTNSVPCCSLHHQPLREDWVPVVYGTVWPSPERRAAERDRFPHAATCVLGGCIHPRGVLEGMLVFAPDPPTVTVVGGGQRRLVRYCPECREAQSAWLLPR